MRQVNSTGGSRSVCRTTHGGLPIVAPTTGAFQWESVDPRTGQSVPYSAADNAAIEGSFSSGAATHVISLGNAIFAIEFSSMRQVNSTGGSRSVCRTVGAPAPAVLLANRTNITQQPTLMPSSQVLLSLSPTGQEICTLLSTSASHQLFVQAAEAIALMGRRCDKVESELGSYWHSFVPSGQRLSVRAVFEGSVDGQTLSVEAVIALYTLFVLPLSTVGQLSNSGEDFSGGAQVAQQRYGDLLAISEGRWVPQYYANVRGESVFRRKYLSLLGLRNLVRLGDTIFCDLFESLFSSNCEGLRTMRNYTGNVVDVDTVVLNCSTQLSIVNKLRAQPAEGTAALPPFRSADEFFNSPEAQQMAYRQSQHVIHAFVDAMALGNQPHVLASRCIALPPEAQWSQRIHVATHNTDRGHYPVWGYQNVGVNTFHANVPNLPDVIGALLRAPFQLIKGFLLCLCRSGVLCKATEDAVIAVLEGDGGAANNGGRATSAAASSSSAPLFNFTAESVATLEKHLGALYSDAVNDSCFNAKWKAIESFVDGMDTINNIDAVINELQSAHQHDIFTPALFERDDESRSLERAALLKLIKKEAVRGRDAVTRTTRKVCASDIDAWIAKTN